jgi:hypothetical protein
MREDIKELRGVLTVTHGYNDRVAKVGQLLNIHNNTGKNGKFKKRTTLYNPLTMKYLAKAWGVGQKYPTQLMNEPSPTTADEVVESMNPSRLPVISSLAAAKVKYSPKNMYIMNQIRVRKEADSQFAHEDNSRNAEVYREEAKADWCLLNANERAYWEQRSRTQIERQPSIADDIINSMRANPSKSYDAVAKDIGNWCSGTTIQKWLRSHSGYNTYAQRTLPLLTSAQKQKHVIFGKHLHNNRGMTEQRKIL